MENENEFINIQIKKTSAKKLDEMKIHRNQPYWEVVEKLLGDQDGN